MSHEPTGQNTGEIQSSTFSTGCGNSVDTSFRVLSKQRRRHVLECLQEYETPIALADLADEVAVQDRDTAITEIPAEEVKEVYISLYHVHIPRMEDAGLVEYDQNDDLVMLLEDGQELIESVL